MKRVYYGPATLDVAEILAEARRHSHTSLTGSIRTHKRSFSGRAVGGTETLPFAAGTSRVVTVSGYLNGGDEADVQILLGGAISIAMAPQSPTIKPSA